MSTNENLHAGHRERTINKFLNYPDAFNEHELLELLLFYAVPRKDTNPLAHRILRVFGSLENVFNASSEELMTVEGVGKSVATTIRVMGQIISVQERFKKKRVRLNAPGDAKALIREYLEGRPNETFILVLLNAKMELITVLEFTDDKTEQVSADIPEITHALSIHRPKFAVIAHNHPSRIFMPSEKDDIATKKVALICNVHGVELADHLILGGNDVYSYRNSGMMDQIRKQMNLDKLLSNI